MDFKNLVFIALFLFAIQALAQFDNKVSVPVSITSPGTLKIDVIDSPISVIGYEGSSVIFEPIPEDKSKRKTFQDFIFNVSKSENDVTIRTHSKRILGIEITVKVPHHFSIEAKTVYGSFVHIENVTGNISVYAHAGNIKLLNSAGSLDLYTANGVVTVTAKSFSNEIPSIITNVYGNTKLILPATIKATFQIDTYSGKVNSDFELKAGSPASNDLLKEAETLKEEVNNTKDKQKAMEIILNIFKSGVNKTINGGGPLVSLKLHSGTLEIRKGK